MKTARTNAHAKLAKELSGLIPSLDEEGLSFLVEQARVHLHNMEIDRLNAESEANAGSGAAASRGKRKAAGASAGETGSDRRQANFRIDRSSSGSSYHVISGGKWKMFNDGEMLAMVNIASSDDEIAEVSARLWAWLDAERPDAYADLDIDGPHDTKMGELVALLRAKFKVRKR